MIKKNAFEESLDSSKKNWYVCPYCGKHLLKHTDKAESHGVYIKCKRCGREIEILIKQ